MSHSFTGKVTPPADMMAAARASLSPEGFEELMRETGGANPTPAQLCRIADREREQGIGVTESDDVVDAEFVSDAVSPN
jgi:hypothetical protein